MTTKPAYSQFIGKQGMFQLQGLDVPVLVLNHRYNFGRDDLEIRAINGTKTKWVQAEAVTINAETK